MQEQNSKNKKPSLRAFFLLAIGLLLLMISNGRWIVPIAAWLSPIFLLRYVRATKNSWQIVLVILATMGVSFIAWQGLIPVPGFLYFAISGAMGLVAFLSFLIDKKISQKIQGFTATLVFPLAYTAIEYINSSLNPYGTWGSLAYTQFGNLPLMQLVSITGIYGITFLITWFASVVNWTWEENFEWSKISKGVLKYASVLVIVLLFGGISLIFFSPKSEEVKVAGVQSDLPLTMKIDEEAAKLEETKDPSRLFSPKQWDYVIQQNKVVIDDLFAKTEIVAKSGAKIVSWAEATVPIYKNDVPALLERGKQLAKQEDIYLILEYFAFLHTDESLLPSKKMVENTATIISPIGEVLSTYRKTIPVPGFEANMSQEGDGNIPLVDTPYGRISTLICFENDFPAFNRKAGKGNVDIVFDPSGDWFEIDPIHTNMHAFRAVENGYSTLRITARGLSAAYDYQGRTLATMDYFKTKDKVFTAYLPTKGIKTVYSQIGDVFAWLCVVGFMAIIVRVMLKRK